MFIKLTFAAAPPTVDDPKNDKIHRNFNTVAFGNKYMGKQ